MLQVKSKYKIGKRLGAGVFEKCQTPKFALVEARAQKSKRRRPPSDYGKQMLEKQRVRYTYGLLEKQFARYVREANKAGQPINALHTSLERRLDNTVYRLGLAPTRRAARQVVSHGHITVNGRRMNTPSYTVREGDSIAVREGSKGHGLFAALAEKAEQGNVPPAWLSFDITSLSGKVVALPQFVPGEGQLDYGAVLEFYSR